MKTRIYTWVATGVLLTGLIAGCSEEDRAEITESAEAAREDIEDAAGSAAARSAAEALRAALKLDDQPESATLRDIAVIERARDQVPGDLQVAGVADADGDGRDDDGLVEVQVGDQAACLMIPAEGTDTSVDNGPCT